MSEADSTPRRRPPTIDLTAKEVETEQPASASQSTEAATAAAGMAGAAHLLVRAQPYAVGIAIGAVAVGAIVAGFWIAGFGPVHEPPAAPPTASTAPRPAAPPTSPTAPGTKTADLDEISARLAKVEEALQAQRPDAALSGRITATEAQTKALGDLLAALTRRVDEVAVASQAAIVQAKSATAAADAAKSATQTDVQRGDVDALANRIAALESAVKSLSTDVAQRTSTSSADDRVLRATVAAEALRAAVERGAPFPAELAAVKALGADEKATAPLVPFAADGIPSAAALGRELAAVIPSLHRASESGPNNDSFFGRLERHAQKLVRVTPLDAAAAPASDDPSSVIARIDGDAARGDIAAARADIAKLPDTVRGLTDGWIKKAEARDAAIAASRHIVAVALNALGKPVSQ